MATTTSADRTLEDLDNRLTTIANQIARVVRDARNQQNQWRSATNASKFERYLKAAEEFKNKYFSR